MEYMIHETAVVEAGAKIGKNTRIWHFTHVCADTSIGEECNIGQSVYIDNNTRIGKHCKIQNNVNIYYGVTLEDYVFCGPSMTFTNVKCPRCLYPTDKTNYLDTRVKYGASIGAHAVIVCGISIGKHALIGSGAVVTKDVPDYALMVGNPAKQIGWICECGERLEQINNTSFSCDGCQLDYVFEIKG